MGADFEVELRGGFGNQLFQLALALRLQEDGFDTLLNGRRVVDRSGKVALETAFGVLPVTIVGTETGRTLARRVDGLGRFSRKVGMPWLSKLAKVLYLRDQAREKQTENALIRSAKIVEEPSWGPAFDPFWERTAGPAYVRGYWQNPQYSVPILSKLEALGRILVDRWPLEGPSPEGESVGIHCRLGDYQTADNQRLYGRIATEAYYRNAAAQVRSRVPEARFYLFSNDIPQAEGLFKEIGIPVTPVQARGPGAEFREFGALSLCRHQIIPNSTFSWWAAQLNPHAGKVVAAPRRWLNDLEDKTIGQWNEVLPPTWLSVEG